MRLSAWRICMGTAALAISAWLPVSASTVVTFDDVAPQLLIGAGSSVASGGLLFASDGFGFSGVDGTVAFSAFANAPANAVDQFLYALNGDGIVVTAVSGTPFKLHGFDASFIAPVGGLGGPGIFAGELWVLGDKGTSVPDFDRFFFDPTDANGDFNFARFDTVTLRGNPYNAFGFLACVYDVNNACVFDLSAGIAPQFALDNIGIPEPSTIALVAAALMVGGLRRRQAR
jgi:hypothetical protein